MALNVSNVRAAMAHVLEVALGSDTQIATAPDRIRPPCLLIGLPTVRYHGSFARGTDVMEIPIYGILPRSHDQAAVDAADEWISGYGPRSILTILETDRTLGGACASLVTREAVAEIWQAASGDLPTIHWTVEVFG